MKEGQKQIYWISAGSQAEAAKSPFLERLVKKVCGGGGGEAGGNRPPGRARLPLCAGPDQPGPFPTPTLHPTHPPTQPTQPTQPQPPKGYEVIFMTDVLDEYVMGQLTEYDDLKLANISKEDLKLGDEKEELKELKEKFSPLTKWWKDRLKDKVGGAGGRRGGGKGGVHIGGVGRGWALPAGHVLRGCRARRGPTPPPQPRHLAHAPNL
jgi:hypothetical protein